MEYEGIIYRYKSPSGKYYIGQTMDEENRRRKFFGKNKIYAGPKINRARKKYGPENFEYTVLMKVTGDNPEEVKEYLNTLEIGFIRMYNSVENGYNSCDGGNNTYGHTVSEEARKRISDAHKGKPSWNKGIPMREETKKKLSESKKGKNTWMKGRKHSEETKRKISESQKGHIYMKGIPKSESHRKALSESRKGLHRVYNPDGTFRMVRDPEPINTLW